MKINICKKNLIFVALFLYFYRENLRNKNYSLHKNADKRENLSPSGENRNFESLRKENSLLKRQMFFFEINKEKNRLFIDKR